MQRISEYWFPITVAFLALFLATIPVLLGYTQEDSRLQFMGYAGRGVTGLNGYMMFSRQAQDGDNLFENKLTAGSTQRTFFNLEWWLIGRTARVTGMSLLASHRVFHGLSTLLLTCAIYALISECATNIFLRRTATLLTAFGSGFGWINVIASKFLYAVGWTHTRVVQTGERTFEGLILNASPDLWAGSTFGALLTQPHDSRALAFSILPWVFVLVGERTQKSRYFLLSGLCVWAHFIIRPYGIPIIYATFFLYPIILGIRDHHFPPDRWKNVALAMIIPAPQFAYYGYLLVADVLGSEGPDLPPYSLVYSIMHLGWPFLLSLAVLPKVLLAQEKSTPIIIIGLWLIVTFVVCQSYPFYKAGMEAGDAYRVAPPILAMIGPLYWLVHWFKMSRLSAWMREEGISYRGQRIVAATLFLLISIPSSLYSYNGMINRAMVPRPPYFLDRDVENAMRWVDENVARTSVVLARSDLAQFVPRISGTRSYCGHYMLTRDAEEKAQRAADFLAFRQSEVNMRHFALENRIAYVIAGPRDVAVLRERQFDWMLEVYGSEDAAVVRLDI